MATEVALEHVLVVGRKLDLHSSHRLKRARARRLSTGQAKRTLYAVKFRCVKDLHRPPNIQKTDTRLNSRQRPLRNEVRAQRITRTFSIVALQTIENPHWGVRGFMRTHLRRQI